MYLLDLAIMMARSAGDLLKARFHTKVNYQLKSDQTFVSEADLASHHLLKQILEHHYPDHAMLSEEDALAELVAQPNTGSTQSLAGSCADQLVRHSSYLWVVDPLDGTSNYIHKLPYFCVTIGCVQLFQDGTYEPLIGVSYNPMSSELYYAQKGEGVFKEVGGGEFAPRALAALKPRPLNEAFVACGFHGDHLQGDYESQYTALIKQAESSRRLGAAALDLARTAEGIFHVFFDDNVKIWDYVAGSLFIEEAGGVCYGFPKAAQGCRYSPKQLGIELSGIIAGAAGVVDEVYDHFKGELR